MPTPAWPTTCIYCLQLPSSTPAQQPTVGAVSLEMNRTLGDEVLFLMPATAGQQLGSMPSLLDYQNYADSTSFMDRSDRHSCLLTNQSGL